MKGVTYSAKKFKLKFGVKPGNFFDLEKEITPELKRDLFANPDVAILKMHFGNATCEGKPDLFYALEIRWWLYEDRIKAVIDHVTFFSNQMEMDKFKLEAEKKSIKLNEN